jgi:L-aspartate oxidase
VLARRAREHPRVEIREGVRVLAPWIEDGRSVGVLTEHGGVRGRATLIATGGYAALWEPTTNPLGAIGEGIVMAYRAGAAVADLEFMQFHPTAVEGSGFLLSEALRGEGAVLRDDHGERFVDELAERDVVARAIAERGRVGLDLRAIERDRFSSLMATLEQDGYDPALAPIPVSPAAHYSIGGIVTDIDGRTSVPGLYAAGECSCTGVHGANRLASNSLLECLVFGRRAALASLSEPAVGDVGEPPAAPADAGREAVTLELRRSMWKHAGLIRSADELEPLRSAPLLLARLLAESALAREESRGAHFRSDFPLADDAFEGHIVQRLGCETQVQTWP